MAKVESWMNRFLARHTDRCRRADWPPLGAEFWEVWRRAFVTHGVTEAVADDASFALALAPPQFLDRHLEALLEAARRCRAAPPATPPPRAPDADRGRSEFDAAAAATWARQGGEQRQYWRALVAARLPLMRRHPVTLELLAAAWCHDPSCVVGSPGPADPADPSETHGPETDPHPVPEPKGTARP